MVRSLRTRCLWEETEATGSRTSRVLMVLIKMSAVLTPLAYSLMLLWQPTN